MGQMTYLKADFSMIAHLFWRSDAKNHKVGRARIAFLKTPPLILFEGCHAHLVCCYLHREGTFYDSYFLSVVPRNSSSVPSKNVVVSVTDKFTRTAE
jgi:hypothetical protein